MFAVLCKHNRISTVIPCFVLSDVSFSRTIEGAFPVHLHLSKMVGTEAHVQTSGCS